MPEEHTSLGGRHSVLHLPCDIIGCDKATFAQVTVPLNEIRYRLCLDCLSRWAAIFEDFLTTSI